MLVRFNIKNFRSFNEKINLETEQFQTQELSMLAGATRGKKEHLISVNGQEILKFSAIFGANAAGKSNIIKALKFMQNTVKHGNLPAGASEDYCKTHAENITKPSYFELEMIINNQNYSYGFEYILNTGKLVSEWLVLLKNDKEIPLFEKKELSQNYSFNDILKKYDFFKIYADGLDGSNSLFLTAMNKNTVGLYKKYPEIQIVQEVFSWITKKLSINYPDNRLQTDSSCLLNEKEFSMFSDLLNSFGTGIQQLRKDLIASQKFIEQLPLKIKDEILKGMDFINHQNNEKAMMGIIIQINDEIFVSKISANSKIETHSILFEHKFFDQSVKFKLDNESDGTKRLFDLIQLLLDKDNKTYVIDELDRRLHPCLTYQFVKTYFELCKQKNVQLIVTTHESRLLDFDLLRRDEIWFINKNKYGESDLYSLEEYNERFDRKIDKAYLEGRYKGVPIFTTVYPVEDDL